MSHIEQWNALAARIRALANAGELYAQFQISDQHDGYAVVKNLGEYCKNIFSDLRSYKVLFEERLPTTVINCFDIFFNGHAVRALDIKCEKMEARAALVFLSAFESEVSFLLSDRQELIRTRSERAFLHLQRLLAVDPDVRSKWKAAFERERSGEVSCEKLGAVHLLWHGIFAFKVDAVGARTDLVFN